jgi:hypothetical protein
MLARLGWIVRAPADAGLDAPGELCATISAARAAMVDFDACSGAEFNALAETVGSMGARLAQVRAQSDKLGLILDDRDEDRALSSAFELYKKSVDLAHSSIGIALLQEEQMRQIEDSLFVNRGRFSKNSLLFRLLVLSIRIEAARIDPEHRAMFAAVASEIDDMERALNATVESAFTELEAIVSETASGREQLQNVERSLHERAQQSIALLRGELARIKTSLQPCAEAGRRVDALLKEADAHTATLVTALQYQDIVRQQIEHVGQGFDDIAAHLAPPGGGRPDPVFLHHAAKVQQTQLKTSRDAIESAAARIVEAGGALLETGAALVREFVDMGRAADLVFLESRVGELFSRETENLVEIAGLSEQTNARITRLLERIEKSLKVFEDDIRGHEFNVLIVALNAQIAAARLPGAGALGRLAEEASLLAGNTASLTRDVGIQLGETLAQLRRIRAESAEARQAITREKDDLINGTKAVADKLGRLNRRIRDTSAEASAGFVEVYDRARAFLPTLRFPGLVATAYAPSEQTCERLLAATGGSAGDALGEEGSERLAAHRSRYTMHQERAVHAAVVAAAGATAVAASPADSAPETDNIDLFDEPPAEPIAAGDPGRAPPADDGVELF